MTIDEFNRMMEENSKKIADYVILPTAVQLVNLVRHRVQQTGKKSSGGLFSEYSDAYKTRKGKRHKDVSFKNFSDTGTMWDSFEIQDIDATLGNVEIIAKMDDDVRPKPIPKKPRSIGTSGGKPKTNQGLMEIHSTAEKTEIIAPSEKEIELVTISMNKRLQELWA